MDRKLFPEMVHVITKHLTNSAKKGVRIAHEWHCEPPVEPRQQNSPVDAFQRRNDLVVNLTVNQVFEDTKYRPGKYLILKSLTITDLSDIRFAGNLQVFASQYAFPTLLMAEHLGLDSIQPHKINWFLKPVSAFPCLRSLVLTDTFLDREGALLLYNLFPQLEAVSLIDVHFSDMTAVHEEMTGALFTRLAKLHLHYNDGGFPPHDQYNLFLACPNLMACHWAFPTGNEKHVFSREFIELRQSYHPEMVREVQELHIVGDMDDYGIALAIANMPTIRSLSMSVGNQLRTLSLDSMSCLAANLCRFESHGPFMSSAAIELILASCPLLHTLIARSMTAQDATRDMEKEWLSGLSLKVLCLSFAFESHEAYLQDAVYERLSRLTQLEQLIMHEPCNDRPGGFGLRLRLAQGLGRLCTLTNLSFLSTLDDFTQTPRQEELNWMDQHWPKLRKYHCAYTGLSMVYQ